MTESRFPWDHIRNQFPALSRRLNDQPVIYLDGPAGSQVPARVAAAVSDYLLTTNANRGAPFATSRESDLILDEAHQVLADFLGAPGPECIAFGANMTTLTLALSRAIGRTWKAGDEIIVSSSDHDANVTPWTLAARDAGVLVRIIPMHTADCTLDLEILGSLLNDRTRLVAVGYASNISGNIHPVRRIVEMAHSVGALAFIDAVHYAPHGLIDVQELNCDFLVASAYKFFGPHVGVLYGRESLLASLTPYKLRPAPEYLPGRWMTGTQNQEGIAGTAEAVRYLADLGKQFDSGAHNRRAALRAAWQAITAHEQRLLRQFLPGLQQLGLKVWGITAADNLHQRVPTLSVTHLTRTPQELASELAQRGIFAWPGNHYALPFTETLGLEPGGTLRLGLLHYNTTVEVERTLKTLAELV